VGGQERVYLGNQGLNMDLGHRCPWYVAGPLMGLLIVGLRATLNRPFGALGGFIDFAENSHAPRRLGFRAYVLLGLVLGGLVFAVAGGTFAPSLAYATATGPAGLALLVGAGLAMGFGARTAGGCTSGHGMCGMSLGSLASIVASMTFFATAVLLARAFAAFGVVR
jgi:uncharacterized protein